MTLIIEVAVGYMLKVIKAGREIKTYKAEFDAIEHGDYKTFISQLGSKMAKMAFEIELNNEITKAIVILCGGDPNKPKHIWT